MHLQLELFKKDVESLQEELMSVSSMDTSQISLYEYFHISPIKVYHFLQYSFCLLSNWRIFVSCRIVGTDNEET